MCKNCGKVAFVVVYRLFFCCLLHSSPSPGWSSSVQICTRLRPVLHCSSGQENGGKRSITALFSFSIFFLTPLIATLFSYTRIAKVIRQHNINALSFLSLHEMKLSKSLFAIVFAFIICWIQFGVIVVLRRFRLVAMMPRSVELFCMLFLYPPNTINPFIYAGMNPVFRRELQNILFRRRNRCNVVISTSSRKETTTNWWGFRCPLNMSCFDSTFPKFSLPLSFSQKTKLGVSYFDVKVVWDINIPGNVWNEFFIRYESLIIEAIHLFDNTLTVIFNEYFSLNKVKVSSRDLPLPFPRNAADLQARLNELIRNNQVDAVRNGNRKHETGIKGWWHGIQCKQNHWQRV